ncbi:MAG: XRE family transcriptional regulator [Burkholderiaceae bacterium]
MRDSTPPDVPATSGPATVTAVPEASPDDAALDRRLATRLAALRAQAHWSLDDLAGRTGISRATLSRLERAETSPSASLLNRLCAAYGLSMSRLLADVETSPLRLLRAADQAVWTDETSGFRRRMVAPPAAGFAAELVEGWLPAGASIAYDQPSVPGLEHHLWLHDGRLRLTLQDQAHELLPGDSLSYQLWGSSRFEVPGPEGARYTLAICNPLPAGAA